MQLMKNNSSQIAYRFDEELIDVYRGKKEMTTNRCLERKVGA